MKPGRKLLRARHIGERSRDNDPYDAPLGVFPHQTELVIGNLIASAMNNLRPDVIQLANLPEDLLYARLVLFTFDLGVIRTRVSEREVNWKD